MFVHLKIKKTALNIKPNDNIPKAKKWKTN